MKCNMYFIPSRIIFVLFSTFKPESSESDEAMPPFGGMPPMAGMPNMPDPSEMSGGSKFDGAKNERKLFNLV